MATFVALLRGINVGGNKPVKMATLKASARRGLRRRADAAAERQRRLHGAGPAGGHRGRRLESAIVAEFGFPVAVDRPYGRGPRGNDPDNPFGREATDDPGHTVVMFSTSDPAEAAVARLAADHAGPEKIASGDRALYIYYPDGIGRSKLTNVADRETDRGFRHGAELEHGDETSGDDPEDRRRLTWRRVGENFEVETSDSGGHAPATLPRMPRVLVLPRDFGDAVTPFIGGSATLAITAPGWRSIPGVGTPASETGTLR